MTQTAIVTNNDYWTVVDELASESTDRIIETAGDDRYADDVAEGMKQTVDEVISDWWSDGQLNGAGHRAIIRYGDFTAYDIASHVRQVDAGTADGGGTDRVEVVPEDVQERVAYVTLKGDVSQAIRDDYAEKLSQAARAEF